MPAPLPCNCPQGYIPTPDGSQCQQILTQPYEPFTQGSVVYKACAGSTSSVYGAFGANFYPNISSNPVPISIPGTQHHFVDNSNTIIPPTNNVQNGLWGNGNASTGRLNNTGLWVCDGAGNPIHTCPDATVADSCPLGEWIGFTVCIDIPIAATYCIGIAGDNGARIVINGVEIVEVTPNNGNSFTFNYWHVFPLNLNAGKTIIHLEGFNDIKIASFAAEIYNATPAQLASFTTVAQLTPTIVFSTLSERGSTFQTGESSGYQCPPGYYLSNCGSLACMKIMDSPCGPCFKLIDCKNPENIKIIDADPSFNLISQIGNVIKVGSLGNTCWGLSVADSCEGAIAIDAIDTITTFATCLLCDPPVCYTLTDCQGLVSPYLIQGDLSAYTSKVIKISNLGTTCWTVALALSCAGATPLDPTASIVSFDTCLECNPICYLLTDCSVTNPNPAVIVTNDLSTYVGRIIKVSTFGPQCWQVTVAGTCDQSVTIDQAAVITPFVDCCTCQALPCYQLVSCIGNPLSPIITKTDLSAFVGKTVNQLVVPNVVIDPTECWTISLLGPCTCPITAPTVTFNTRAYEDCQCCNVPGPRPLPVLPLRVIPAPVKDFVRETMSPCEIQANINFAQSYWNLTKKYRYGITTCEWNKDVNELWVTFQLAQLAQSIDTLYCIPTVQTCFVPEPCTDLDCRCNPPMENNPRVRQQHPHRNRVAIQPRPPFIGVGCQTCGPAPCSCGNPSQRFSNCGCLPIFAGMPLREPEPPQTFLLWSDYGVMLWEDQNGILTE